MTDIEQYQPSMDLAVTQDVAVQRLGDWARNADAAYGVAERLSQSSFVPSQFRGKPVELTAAMLSGLELGLSPMASMRSFDIISGQAAPRAITLRAVVQSHGHEMVLVESTNTRCRMKGKRRGSDEWQTVTWTMDRAKDLGLVGKDNWRKQPGAMLVARATSELARLIASDAILGIGYSSEEVADGATDQQTVTVEPAAVTSGTRKMSRRKPAPAPEPAPEPVVEDDHLDPKSDLARAMFASFNDADITDRDERLAYVSRVVGREVSSSSEMTRSDAHAVLESLTADAEALRTGVEDPDTDDPTLSPDWDQR